MRRQVRVAVRPWGREVVREAREERALLLCLLAVVALLSLAASAGPALLDRLAGDALASRAAAAQRTESLIRQSAELHPPENAPIDPAMSTLGRELPHAAAQFVRAAKPPLAGALRVVSTRVEVPAARTATGAGPVDLGLLYADDPPPRSAYVQGRPPGRATARGPVDLAVSVRTRDALHLHIGQLLDLEPGDGRYRTAARVTGVFAAPPAGTAPLWRQEPLLERPSAGDEVVQAQALIDASALDALQNANAGDLTVTWRSTWLPDGRAATAAATPAGLVGLTRAAAAYATDSGDRYCRWGDGDYGSTACMIGGHGTNALATADDLPALVRQFTAERAQARTLESFALAGLLGVGLATVVVAARLAMHRRAAAQALQRARGASATDLAFVRAVQTAPPVLAGLLAGLAAGRALAPAGTAPGSALPAVAVALAVWLTLPALTWFALRDRGRRQEQPPRGARRITAEALVLLLAVAGVAALRTRGSGDGTGSGIDPQLAAVPVLLGLAAVVVLIRVYPLPVRLLAGIARRGRGVIGTVGLSRAAGRAPGQALALLVLVATLSTAVFGGLVSRTVADGRRTAAVWSAGADATVVGAARDGTPEPDLARSPGVRHAVGLRAATARLTSGRDGTTYEQARVVGVDAAALHAAAPGSVLARDLLAGRLAGPPPRPGHDGRVVLSALATADLGSSAVGDIYTSSLRTGLVSFRIVGTAAGAVRQDPALGPLAGADAARAAVPGGDVGAPAPDGPMLLLDASALSVLGPHDTDFTEALLYGPRLDAAALHVTAARIAGPTGRLLLRSDLLGQADDDGLLRAVQRVYAAGTALSVVLALLALVLDLLLSAHERGRTASRLRTLGLPTRGIAALGAVELLPMALTAVAGGVALGLALPAVLGPALTLRQFTGGPVAPPLHTDFLLTTALGAGLALLIAAAVATETRLARRRGLGAVLRLGDPP